MTPYLKKHARFPAQIFGIPSPNLELVVVIPAYKEKDLLKSLASLKNCDLPTAADVEVIVVFNDSEKDTVAIKDLNKKMYEQACKWSLKNSRNRLKYHILYHSDLPKKEAGVGLARKIGLDEGVFRFEAVQNPKGILCCFDADSLCEKNYFEAIYDHFKKHPKAKACGIHFEHPIDGNKFPKKVYRAITLYELHLRYFVLAQRFTKFPFAFQTIGSSMATRCDAYQQQGGMNKRKAGEDFYFLHKFITLGNFKEIRTTKVIPSPRLSDRVPFGTGKAIGEITNQKKLFETYAPESFQDLAKFFKEVPHFFASSEIEIQQIVKQLPPSIQGYLEKVDFTKRLREIRGNTATLNAFEHRFFKWFNAFQLMKFVHFSRDHFHENVPVEEAAHWLIESHLKKDISDHLDPKELLLVLRMIE